MAEVVDCNETLDTLRVIGLDLAQGYQFDESVFLVTVTLPLMDKVRQIRTRWLLV